MPAVRVGLLSYKILSVNIEKDALITWCLDNCKCASTLSEWHKFDEEERKFLENIWEGDEDLEDYPPESWFWQGESGLTAELRPAARIRNLRNGGTGYIAMPSERRRRRWQQGSNCRQDPACLRNVLPLKKPVVLMKPLGGR